MNWAADTKNPFKRVHTAAEHVFNVFSVSGRELVRGSRSLAHVSSQSRLLCGGAAHGDDWCSRREHTQAGRSGDKDETGC